MVATWINRRLLLFELYSNVSTEIIFATQAMPHAERITPKWHKSVLRNRQNTGFSDFPSCYGGNIRRHTGLASSSVAPLQISGDA
jgi:hypothetical protein